MPDKLNEYTEGFNHGYLLQKYLPDLAEKLSKQSNPESDYLTGLIAGKQENQLEQIRNKKELFPKETLIKDAFRDREKDA